MKVGFGADRSSRYAPSERTQEEGGGRVIAPEVMQGTLFDVEIDREPELTVLSYGGGQDSTAILLRLIHDPEYRARWAPNRLVVVTADTGDEHDETYAYIEDVARPLCAEHGIEYHLLTADMGFHSEAWQTLIHQYRRNDTVGSKAYPKTCTDNLKVKPIYRWLEYWLHEQYGVRWRGAGHAVMWKQGVRDFTARHGKVRVLIGIAGDEAKRRAGGEMPAAWMRECLDRAYPLVDDGWNRQKCQDYIAELGYPVPAPSNCRRCPFMDLKELLLLARRDRAGYDEWVELEAAKLRANASKGEKNFGVWGKDKTLPQMLALAEEKHGHMTLEELEHHRFSHGHCVGSRY